MQTVQNGRGTESEAYAEQSFFESPFLDSHQHEQEEPHEASIGEALAANWEFVTPFLPGEATETGESEAAVPEVAEFSEITAELKDTLFREALEQLADEALEAHSSQLAGEYGDHEMRDQEAEYLLNQHFEPLAAQMEAMLDRFFERVEGYEAVPACRRFWSVRRIPAALGLAGIGDPDFTSRWKAIGVFSGGGVADKRPGISVAGFGLAV